MSYTIAKDIIPAVRVILDYNETEDALDVVDEVDTLALDTIIKSQTQDALRWCLLNAPKEWLTWSQATDGGVKTSGDTTYYEVYLPNGFLRYGSAKLSTWKVPCYDMCTPEDKEYTKQFGEFDGLKATALRPVAAQVLAAKASYTDSEGNTKYADNVLQLFGAVSSDTTLSYCDVALLIDTSNSFDMRAQLLAPLVYVTAAFTANVLKDTNRYTNFMQQAQALMMTAEDSATAAMINAQQQQQ